LVKAELYGQVVLAGLAARLRRGDGLAGRVRARLAEVADEDARVLEDGRVLGDLLRLLQELTRLVVLDVVAVDLQDDGELPVANLEVRARHADAARLVAALDLAHEASAVERGVELDLAARRRGRDELLIGGLDGLVLLVDHRLDARAQQLLHDGRAARGLAGLARVLLAGGHEVLDGEVRRLHVEQLLDLGLLDVDAEQGVRLLAQGLHRVDLLAVPPPLVRLAQARADLAAGRLFDRDAHGRFSFTGTESASAGRRGC
jgi:hypothetical protein